VTSLEPPARRSPRIVEVVLGAARPPARRGPLALAVVLALLGHLLPLAVLLRSRGSLEPWAATLAARIHEELGRETLVEATPPPPLPPRVEPPRPPPRHAPPAPGEPRPRPPAQAGQVIAQAPNPSAPLDLTGEAFVTGTAANYAGGFTSSTGTSAKAVESRAVDLSRPVGLVNGEWRCPWPTTADSADIDRAVAVVEVRVRVDGTAESVSVVRDPGMGFGEAAVGCALRELYEPARDRSGAAVAALSPPIRVRFTR
jgi:protein TonB